MSRGERGCPRLPAAEVVRTLQFFLREGVQWRELFAGTGRASGSTLRRRLREWRDVALLPRVHAVLLRMTQSSPEAAARAWGTSRISAEIYGSGMHAILA